MGKFIIDIFKASPKWLRWLLGLCVLALVVIIIVRGIIIKWAGEEYGVENPAKQEIVDQSEINPPIISDMVEWERKKYVAEAAQAYATDNKEAIEKISACFPKFNSGTLEVAQKVITKDEAREIIESPKQKELLFSIQSLLNYLEGLSTAYQTGVADPEMFKTSFEPLIKRWYGRLEGFILVYKDRCQCTWTPFEKLGAEWKDKSVTVLNGKGLGECINYNKIT